MTEVYRFERAFTPEGWRGPLWVEIDASGWIVAVHPTEPLEAQPVAVSGAVLPGVPNLHSHAFQRALAGRTEAAGFGENFWSWRESMYRLVAQITPDDLEVIAGQAFVEMLEAGYTSVAEFHYLHNAASGERYADPGEMSGSIVRAAANAGIGLTLLPVLYTGSGFGQASVLPEQSRFVLEVDELMAIVSELVLRHTGNPQLRVGIAPHSLRAVTASGLRAAIDGLSKIDPTAPIHVHAAEQRREVEECRAFFGTGPITWLLDSVGLDRRWCVVHATQLEASEIRPLAESQAVVGLCPSTEANLGDGLFPLKRFLECDGLIGIGSDSNVCLSPTEELRWLEYGQRLSELRRNVAAAGDELSTGARLYRSALRGGSRALARPIGAIAPGLRADLIVLDSDHPALVAREPESMLDGWIFCAGSNPIRDVMVGGRWVVRDGRHQAREAIAEDYRGVMRRLYRA